MSIEKDLKQTTGGTTKKVKWGCLVPAILILSPIILFVGWFSYDMYFKEVTLVKSHSPNNIHTIKVVQKGSAFLFGPSSVRITYGWWKHLDRSIANDGKSLDSSNVSVSWKNDDEATITLYGEEQEPEVVEFNMSNESNGDKLDSKLIEEIQQEFGSVTFKRNESNRDESDSKPVEETQQEFGFFTFKTNESPNLINIIEFREVGSSVQIYYGRRGSVLEKSKAFTLTEMYTPDNFHVKWRNDEQVKIDVVRETESGEIYIEDTIEIDFSE